MSTLLVVLVVLAIARITRLVTTDTLFEPLREKLYIASVAGDEWYQEENRIIHRPGRKAAVQRFFVQLTSCDWCTSIWVTTAVAAIAYYAHSDAWFFYVALALAASHLTGLLSAIEGRLYADHEH